MQVSVAVAAVAVVIYKAQQIYSSGGGLWTGKLCPWWCTALRLHRGGRDQTDVDMVHRARGARGSGLWHVGGVARHAAHGQA